MRLFNDIFCADVSIWGFLLKIDMTFNKMQCNNFIDSK